MPIRAGSHDDPHGSNRDERDHGPTPHALISPRPETEHAICVELLPSGYFRYTLML